MHHFNKQLFTCKYFLNSSLLVVLHQLFLAISSYCIAKAGAYLASTDTQLAINYIIYFFIFALLAYLFGSSTNYVVTKMQNFLWGKYVEQTILEIENKQTISSEKNKVIFTNWLVGEAKETIDAVCVLLVDFLSTYLNVILTILVFGIAISMKFATVFLIAMLIIALMLTYFKKTIKTLADENQTEKVATMSLISSLWQGAMFGHEKIRDSAWKAFQFAANKYYQQKEKYVIVEQLIATLPVFSAVFLIIAMLTIDQFDPLTIGAMVALLPRTLQLLSNVHSIGRLNGQLVFLKKRFLNLSKFVDTLDYQHLMDQITFDQVKVKDLIHGRNLQPKEFLEDMIAAKYQLGRFLIYGDNGVGKSSILRLIKSHRTSAVMISPEMRMNAIAISMSSGQLLKEQIEALIDSCADTIILDEWDANLDSNNIKLLNDKLNELAKSYLIIEVRHRV